MTTNDILIERKNIARKISSGSIKEFLKDVFILKRFDKPEFNNLVDGSPAFVDRYVVIWLKNAKAVVGGIIKKIDDTMFCEDVAFVVQCIDTNRESRIPKSNVATITNNISSENEFKELMEKAMKAGFHRVGSLQYTYLGIAYVSSETLLTLLEMEEVRSLKDEFFDNTLKTEITRASNELQNSPYEAAVLKEFLSKMALLINNLPFTNINRVVVTSLTNLLTNMMSSLIVASITDSEMQRQSVQIDVFSADFKPKQTKRRELKEVDFVQSGIAFPSPNDQEHLLIIRLNITAAVFTQGVYPDKVLVRNGLKCLCQLFDRIYNGKKRIDELDDHGMIVSQNLVDRFNFSATIGFGASFFEQLDIPVNKRPKKLREMPDHRELGDVTPYSLGQTDLIIQLGSTKDFVNRWVLENSLQPDDDEAIEKLLKKQRGDTLSNETEKKILKELLEDTTPEGVALKDGERCCTDGQVLSSDEECVPDIISAIQGWATITDVHAGFQRIDGRNLMGFNDEVSNPKPGDGIFDNIVFVDKGNEDAQFAGGTYMVFQKIEHNSDQWREFSLDKQQQWVGLSKGTGLLLGTLDEDEDQRLAVNLRSNNEDVRNEAAFDIKQLLKVQMNPETRFFDENGNTIEVQGKHKTYKIHPKNIRKKVPAWSHVRKSNPRREDGAPQITIFRRGYPFVETGLNNKIRSGLLFICFQKDIENGFEYITKRFLNNKNFPVPERRKFTEDELKERHKSGRFSVTELRHLTANERKVLGLDDEEFNKALKEAGVVNPDIDKDFTTSDIYKNDLDLVPDSQRTGREGLAGPSENGVIPDGEFLAIIPFGGGYYFVPPIPNKSTKDIGQQFFE